MPLSEELVVDWYWYCFNLCGYILPINRIYIADSGLVRMGFAVSDTDKPVLTTDNVRVREVMIEYDAEEVAQEWIH